MKRFRSVCLAAMALAVLPLPCARAQKVATDKKGQLFFTDAAGKRTQLAKEGRNAEPCLDPQKRRIVFVRATPGRKISTPVEDEEAKELHLIDIDGQNETVIARGTFAPEPEKLLAGLARPQFSPDGQTVYFVSLAWVTSPAIHACDLASGAIRFVCPGYDLEVVPNGEYAGHLLARQHRYLLGGGTFEWYWLLKPDGGEVGPVGETAKGFRDTYYEKR